MLAAISIVSPGNRPLLMWPMTADADLSSLESAAFTSLDVVDERALMKRANTSGASSDSAYLGLLCVMEDYRVFG